METLITFVIIPALLLSPSTAFVMTGNYRQCPEDFPNDTEDVCTDPVHHHHTGHTPIWTSASLDESFMQHLLSASRAFANTLRNKLTQFERTHIPCNKVKKTLQQIEISDLLEVNFCTPHTVMNNYTRMFTNTAETTQLLHLAASLGAERCCFTVNHLHTRMKNRVLSHWYAVYRSRGEALSPSQCHIKVTPLSTNALRCDDIRDLVYVILRQAIRQTNDSIQFLEQT